MSQQLKELAQLATPWPWKWFTSNSHNRLSSVPSGKDGDVISAFKAVDGVACVSVSRADMAFIEAAHPGAVIELITSNEILSHEFEETKQLLRGTREKLTRAIDRNVAKDIEIKRLSAVERERDELKRNQELNLKIKQAMHERFTRAEAELARRDAAALEPVAVVDIQRGRGDGKKFALCYTSAGHSLPDDVYNLYTAAPPAADRVPDYWQFKCVNGDWIGISESGMRQAVSEGIEVRPLYTAAQPAVLPDEITIEDAYEETHRTGWDKEYAYCAGAKYMRDQFLALGAQPQKPVVLPEIIRHELIDVLTWIERLPVPTKSAAAKAIRLRKAINDIDAANVKWELKP